MVAIGWAEGLSHVNVRKVYIITWWWIGSLVPICLITAALMAQGMAMARWCVAVCVRVCVACQQNLQHSAEPDKDTAADSSKAP